MSRALFFLCFGALALSYSAYADPIRRTMPACVSEELLDELTTYAAKGDREGTAELLRSGKCVALLAGEEVSVIRPGFLVATIRYKGVKLFTPSEALVR